MPRFNCCVFNHPCPIFCPLIPCGCTSNTVVNPSFGNDFGFFNNTSPGSIASQAVIPLGLVINEGGSVVPSANGGVTLAAGVYEVSYFANGTVSANGTLSIKLVLNNADVPGSVVTSTQAAGDVSSLTQTMILTVQQPSTLLLVNNSQDLTTFSNASMSIRRI